MAAPQGWPLVDIRILERRATWRFPYDPFVEYGPEDEAWARGVGLGHEEPEEVINEFTGITREIVITPNEPDNWHGAPAVLRTETVTFQCEFVASENWPEELLTETESEG